MPDLLPLTGLFGKVPAHGDFVRRGLPSSFVTPWDEWLQAGMSLAREALGARWQAAWDSAPAWRFALPAGVCGPDAVAGVMLPSEDTVGRRFPITLAALLPRGAAPPVAAWFDALEGAALAGRDGRADADALAAAIPPPGDLVLPLPAFALPGTPASQQPAVGMPGEPVDDGAPTGLPASPAEVFDLLGADSGPPGAVLPEPAAGPGPDDIFALLGGGDGGSGTGEPPGDVLAAFAPAPDPAQRSDTAADMSAQDEVAEPVDPLALLIAGAGPARLPEFPEGHADPLASLMNQVPAAPAESEDPAPDPLALLIGGAGPASLPLPPPAEGAVDPLLSLMGEAPPPPAAAQATDSDPLAALIGGAYDPAQVDTRATAAPDPLLALMGAAPDVPAPAVSLPAGPEDPLVALMAGLPAAGGPDEDQPAPPAIPVDTDFLLAPPGSPGAGQQPATDALVLPPVEAPPAPEGGGWWTRGAARVPPLVWALPGLPSPAEFAYLLEAEA